MRCAEMPSYEIKIFIAGALSAVYFGLMFISYRKFLENRQLKKEILEIEREIDLKNKDKRR